jgi:hypothetical protein
MKIFRWVRVVVWSMVMVVGFWGCSKNSTDSDTSYASVRFIHSSPSSGLIDFAYLGQDVNYYYSIVTEAAYGGQYGYFSLATDSRSFRAYTSETSLSIASITFSLEENRKYSIIADDLEAAINPTLLGIEDTTAIPDSGKAFLRFIHISADAPDLDIVKADSSLLITDLKRYNASAYVEMDAGTYDFSAVTSGSENTVLTLPPLTLTSGINYSVIFSGSAYGLPGAELNVKIYPEMGVE